MSYYNDLITIIKSKYSTNIIVSAIIPRPCDLEKDPTEKRVKKMNIEFKKKKNVQKKTFTIFAYV